MRYVAHDHTMTCFLMINRSANKRTVYMYSRDGPGTINGSQSISQADFTKLYTYIAVLAEVAHLHLFFFFTYTSRGRK